MYSGFLAYLTYMDRFGLPCAGVIHVGANHAAEAREYDAYGKVPVAFFEPVPAVYEKAVKATAPFPNQRVFHACCADVDGREVTFNVSSNAGASSSMFPLGRHAQVTPGVTYVDSIALKTCRVETILKEHYRLDDFNLAVIDTQGADFLVLKGFGRFIDYIDAIYIEVSDTPLYEGGATFDEIYRYLNDLDYSLSMLETNNADWGNAFFKRRQPVYVRETVNAVSKGKPVTQSSTLSGWKPEYGNDGDIIHRRKFFHTKKEESPWWKVDLELSTAIKKVYLYDCPGQTERAKSLVVEVSEDNQTWLKIHDRAGAIVKAGAAVISWRGRARYVRVRLAEQNYLQLRQVAVIEDEFA
jgi:FkbM family methyltransferase